MDKALLIIEGAIEKAKKIGQPMNIAIVDAGANRMAFTSVCRSRIWRSSSRQRSRSPHRCSAPTSRSSDARSLQSKI
jgi:hypothetical protein